MVLTSPAPSSRAPSRRSSRPTAHPLSSLSPALRPTRTRAESSTGSHSPFRHNSALGVRSPMDISKRNGRRLPSTRPTPITARPHYRSSVHPLTLDSLPDDPSYHAPSRPGQPRVRRRHLTFLDRERTLRARRSTRLSTSRLDWMLGVLGLQQKRPCMRECSYRRWPST